ncbi:MAG: cytochrome c biogenesis protein CcsA, partial [Chloroflexi bacterium]|nr:cytochrome c biogenesis protein CcsA [Chloroflexota bacterium]
TEAVQGVVQRIFYFHVPLAWVSFLAFFVVFVGSVLYLWRHEAKWDILAYSSAEIGVVFTTLVLITGSIWAKPMWGQWWTWDPRLTTSAILWLIYIAYLMVRAYAAEASQAARWAAVVGIVGFVDVPIVALSIILWRTIHPQPLVFRTGGLVASMQVTLMVSLFAFTIFYIFLLRERVALRRMETEVEILRQNVS